MSASQSAELFIFTYRKGLLARFGHDLRLRAHAFEIELLAGRLLGRVSLQSLRVDGAIEHDQLNAEVPSAADRAEIERTLASRILDVTRHPEATFEGAVQAQGERMLFSGQLTLHGRTQPLQAEGTWRDGRVQARAQLIPSRWGIEPYKAMGGALRLDDRIDVRVSLPLDTDFTPARATDISTRWSVGS